MNKITYIDSISTIKPEQLNGFFVDWPNPPKIKTHLEILKNSTYVVLAFDCNRCVGFINALADKILTAYIPLLEVLPEYKSKGIGKELVSKMIKKLDGLYMIDLLCDEEVQKYYEKLDLGFIKSKGMCIRNYNNQAGVKNV